jgi:hypothetical protein
METNKSQPSELFSKILLGMKKASRKLVEESAAHGRSLVVCIDGEVKKVPARDLLSKVSETN